MVVPAPVVMETSEGLTVELRSQLANEFISTLSNALEESCFSRCIKKPGIKLEKADEACLARCMDRYLESWGIVSQTVARVQRKLADQESAEH